MIAKAVNAIVLVAMLVLTMIVIRQIGLTALDAMRDPYPDACAGLIAAECIALSQEGGW